MTDLWNRPPPAQLDPARAQESIARLRTLAADELLSITTVNQVDREIERLQTLISEHEERQSRLDDRDEMERRYR